MDFHDRSGLHIHESVNNTNLKMFNASGSLGSTFIKFYMCLHRYFVLRDVSMNEQVVYLNKNCTIITLTGLVQ